MVSGVHVAILLVMQVITRKVGLMDGHAMIVGRWFR